MTTLAATIGRAPVDTPYTIHKATPDVNVVSIAPDRSLTDPVRHDLSTCGTNESVVSVPAMTPTRPLQEGEGKGQWYAKALSLTES